jgi:hypothetical protein
LISPFLDDFLYFLVAQSLLFRAEISGVEAQAATITQGKSPAHVLIQELISCSFLGDPINN